MVVFLSLIGLGAIILYERGHSAKSHRLLRCSVKYQDGLATIEFVTESPGVTNATFNKKVTTVISEKNVRKTNHRLQVSSLFSDSRYTFTIDLPNGSKTLPLSFSTKSPISHLRMKAKDGKKRISWKHGESGELACRYRSGDEWKAIDVRTAGVDESFIEFSSIELPDVIELSISRHEKIDFEAIFSLAADEILAHTLKDNIVYVKTKKLFARGPSPGIPWQRGALPMEDEFVDLTNLLGQVKPSLIRLMVSKNLPLWRKQALFASLSQCRMLGNWAPVKAREVLWSLEGVGQSFCAMNELSFEAFVQQKESAKTLLSYDNWCFFVPTNFAHDGRRTIHQNRLERFIPGAKALITARATISRQGRLLLHLGNFWMGSMLRIRIGAMYIVLFGKKPAKGTRKINGKRLLASSFWAIDLPKNIVGSKGLQLVIDEFARYEMAQLPALKGIYLVAY